MKTITSNYVTRLLLACFWILVFHSTAHAQSNGSYISWNNQVGCITYDSQGNPSDPRKELILTEDIENAPCVRVCENSVVTYSMNGPNITAVQWSAAGGAIVSSSGTNATISWGSAGSGAVTVTVTYSNGNQATYTICIEIINGPRAEFSFFGLDQPVFCLDTPINFENLSIDNGGTEIVYYQWDFADGNFSSAFEPTHSYDHAGTYEVTLTVTNKCNCSNTFKLKITIENRPNVVINCPSVVCETDEKHEYTVDDDCGGEWLVEGGHITSQTPTSVTVVWDAVGNSGFGSVSYRSNCTCPFWTTVKIPVVKKIGFIEGKATLCVGEQGLYTLPQWPTTDFVWTLTPTSPTTAEIVYIDQRNQVIVNALAAGSYDLRCNYTNTLLGCSGTATIKIRVIGGTVITGGTTAICSGTALPTPFTTTSGAVVLWEVKKNNAVIYTTSAVSLPYVFSTGGVYTITATASGGCSGEPAVVNVTQTPAAPTGPLTGETKYCTGVPYEYVLNNTVPNTVLEWAVTNGTIQGDNTGNNVTIVFGSSATATITVKRRSLDGMGCLSSAYTVVVNKLVITPTITPNATGVLFCPSTQYTFNANLNGVTADMIEWSISPANFGNVVSGINSNTVVVSWNEISSSSTGTLVLRVKKCGQDQYFNTTINLQPAPTLTLTAPNQICYGSPLNLNLTAPGITTGTITWDFGNGVTQTTPVNGTSNYTFANPYNNTTTSNINYNITATLNLPNGCNYSVNAMDTILVFPRTIISITPGYNYTVCGTSYPAFTLSSNATTGLGVTVTYKWYKNNAPIGPNSTSSTYTISNASQSTSPQGVYFVRVTDSNGCVTDSQNITVINDCAPIPPCNSNIIPAPNLNLTLNWNACNNISATASYAGTPLSVQWQGSPFLTLLPGSNNTTAQFSTDTPGAHLVTVSVTFQTASGPCTVQKTVEVKKHYKADFNTTIACNSSGSVPSYNVSLLNNSTVFDVSSPITYTFSGTGMPTQTGQVINLTGLAPGTYTYTLTLSMAGKPNCTITKTITLAAAPVVNFTIAAGYTYCAEEPITLTIPSYNPANTYTWSFFGTSYVASGATTQININPSASGVFPISLTAHTPQGCNYTGNSQLVTINKASFLGNLSVTPSANVCEGATPAPTITFAPSVGNPAMPTAYAWMRGNLQVGTGISYSPTVSGNYWAKLIDANGCAYTLTPSVSVIIRQRPYAGIVGSTTVCAGEQGTIQGVITNTLLERRWLLNNNPMGSPYGTWSATTPLTITVPTAPGTYNYTLEVRPATDATCGNTANISVTVYPALTAPTINYNVVSCEPYQVHVTASGPSTGTYNWSSGDVGQSILIDYGGALGVTYTATTGCSVSADTMIPQPAERSLWMFPTGCYDICLYTTPVPYIIGPLGVFDHYEWLVNNMVNGSGNNTNIQPRTVTQAGTYQLAITNDGCLFESGIMNVAPNLDECEIVDCNFKIDFKEEIGYQNGMYSLIGSIYNPTSSPITVTITSFNNYGTFTPNVVTVPALSYYNFSPLYFTPNANFTGGEDYIVFQMSGCMKLHRVKYPEIEGLQGMRMSNQQITRPASLIAVPNPATAYTTVHYDLGDSYKNVESVILFDVLGNQKFIQKLDKPQGEIEIQLSNLPSGTYIVSIQADGRRVMQQTIVKK